jgi:diguanylate cyclase (GGDEF)-like protein
VDASILTAGMTGLVGGAAAAAVPAMLMLHRALARLRDLDQTLNVVRYDAEHDGLTGLANRAAFYDRAARTLATNPRGQQMAVALVDVDDFKQVNDTHGHGVGDLVLHVLARRLQDAVGAGTLVTRLGGDEFAAIVPLGEGESPLGFGSALCTVGHAPVDLDEFAVHVSVSVGVVPVNGPADLAVLLGRADNAMYRAKNDNVVTGYTADGRPVRLHVAIYDPRLDDDAVPMPATRPEVRTRDLDAGSPLVALSQAVIA